ncbi:MAG: sensor histidine kinase [Bacteroidetes bacterium]|nr:sensor histidine kinase [Bacteroidota bacterium]
MRTPSPRQIILFTSFIIASASLLVFLGINIGLNLNIPVAFLLINPVVIFLLSMIILRYTMERFVNSKIKIIYKTIGKPRKFHRELRDNNRNIIKTVEHDVAEWAINKNKQIRELKKLETYRREFVGNVSHELKTPIFNALGYLETLEDGGKENPAILDKYLKKAINNVERLDTIVKDLEDISKYESGSLHLEKAPFDIVELVRDILSNMQILSDEQDITLEFQDIKGAEMVWADKSRMEQVLVNLVSNSIKYGRYGGTTDIQFYDLDEQLLVEVSDNGPGIAEQDLPRLFERFFRVDKTGARKTGGTGLGLSIVKNIIEAHQQIINVRSEVGIGTTFAFTLQKYIPED